MPTELTKRIEGGVVYGEPSARSTRFLAASISTSNEVMERLKSTFQAAGFMTLSDVQHSVDYQILPLCMMWVMDCRTYKTD